MPASKDEKQTFEISITAEGDKGGTVDTTLKAKGLEDKTGPRFEVTVEK